MPLMDRRSNLTAANARASDVAKRLTEDIVPIFQERLMSAFRVQGMQAILYNRLSTGIACGCKTREKTVGLRLNADGKASPGQINEVLTGGRFGVDRYSPLTPDEEFDEFENFGDGPTSPNNRISQFMGDLIKAGDDGSDVNLRTDDPTLGSVRQFSPDFDALYQEYDLGSIGISDISCPVCFGSGFIGGFTPFRSWRKVVSALEVTSTSTLDIVEAPPKMRPGTHTFTITLPRGAQVLDVFRVMNGDLVVPAEIQIDGIDTANKRVLNWFDGQSHLVTLICDSPFTHFEAQAGLSKEPIYFEFPRRSKSADISMLEKMEPFQIIVSPDVPHMDTLDVIVESQLGKVLIVQNTDPWRSRNRQFLGWNCQVRVAQPQELLRILPSRSPISGAKTVNAAHPSKGTSIAGLSAGRGQGFTF